jgi:arginine decarboxylase
MHSADLYMPIFEEDSEKQYIGFFHTGAYQESLGGYGGIQHCLIPAPKHVLVDKDEEGRIVTRVFAEEQHSDSMLKILGFKDESYTAPETNKSTEMQPVEAEEELAETKI